MTKTFARFARKAGLTDVSLAKAAVEVAAGEFDADLGGHVYKQRVARAGGGKSGGFRTIILFKVGGHSFFAHGFAKNEKANVTAKELKALKKLAEVLLDLSDGDIDKGIAAGEFVKVEDDDEAQES
ncbi:type II toxin-antitoxin system RelE/ParE family toxin [Sphingomonas sp.]|uniref:type II toxin-antitoxin system RelE/ParE family toxin n=1 Tax=Sphingomonas sp. TaxID=28214 RepID=UPI003F6FD69B